MTMEFLKWASWFFCILWKSTHRNRPLLAIGNENQKENVDGA